MRNKRVQDFAVLALVIALIVISVIEAQENPVWTLLIAGLVIGVMMRFYRFFTNGFFRIVAMAKGPVANVEEGTARLLMFNGKASRVMTSDRKKDPVDTWKLPRRLFSATCSVSNVVNELRDPPDKLTGIGKWIDENLLSGGLRWKGFSFEGYDLFDYHFRWDTPRNQKPAPRESGLLEVTELENGTYVASFAKTLDYIYTTKLAVYSFEITNAETKARVKKSVNPDDPTDTGAASIGMAVKVYANISVTVIDPCLALTGMHDFLQSIFNIIRPSIRSWISTKYYEEVIGKPEVAQREFDIFLNQTGITAEITADANLRGIDLTKHPLICYRDYIELLAGVIIEKIGFDDVVPPPAYTAAVNARVASEQEAITIINFANANAEATRIQASAEADAVETLTGKVRDGGDVAMDLERQRTTRALAEGGNVFVVNSSQQALFLDPRGRSTDKDNQNNPQKHSPRPNRPRPNKKKNESDPVVKA